MAAARQLLGSDSAAEEADTAVFAASAPPAPSTLSPKYVRGGLAELARPTAVVPPALPPGVWVVPSPPAAPQGLASSGEADEPTGRRAPALIALTRARSAGSGCYRIRWVVDARKLATQDRQAVSPQFDLDLPDFGPTPFKMALHAKTDQLGGGFKSAGGRGRVDLKCEAPLPHSMHVEFSIGIGRDGREQPLRGPVSHNFSERSCCGLPPSEEEWDFGSAVDENRTFTIRLVAAPLLPHRGGGDGCGGDCTL